MPAMLRHPCTPACAPRGRAARQAQRARARRLLRSGAFRRCTQQRPLLRFISGHAKHLYNSCAARPGARAVPGRRGRTTARGAPLPSA